MSKERKIVVFNIDGEEFAAEISQVERILGYMEPVKIPEAPVFIKGVIKYEGSIIPVIDIKKRFNLNSTEIKSEQKIIVVKNEDKKAGLIVDNVSEVTDIAEDNIEDAPEIVKGVSNKYISSIIKINERIIILINTENILSRDEMMSLNSIM
ncbi:purine-binding chemotaxis protein CheW [Caloramator quimbayensis]|uniref:Purine-binding chemotaxis protein CheW n=1 Tax=Caloramator quimbayensis TaxID=1147123 RepID=A0A1T4XAF7_9CLOT|nr:chemotaxis protein CheW [Caloramator quimbayensis]SKA86095.1 purine-binding chemotaxis protein CheW [Caloramator quimbayensis]